MNIAARTAVAVGMAGVLAIVPVRARAAGTGKDTHDDKVMQKIAAMQKRIDALQAQLQELKREQAGQAADRRKARQASTAAVAAAKKARKKAEEVARRQTSGIHLGGAMRFQYVYEDYSKGSVRRHGDLDYDIFRLDLDGKVDQIILSAQWRWFQYMSAIQHAWIGYDVSKNQQLQLGITRIPFGNQPYDSHNYFFSSNYYLGLEDTHAAGAEYVFSGSPWNVQLAFFKNDGLGGVSGDVRSRADSYSYHVVGIRRPGEGIYADPAHPVGTVDTAAARVAYTFRKNSTVKVEIGASALRGGLNDGVSHVGTHDAYALHLDADIHRWNIQLQAARYGYHVPGGVTRMAVGAYAFFDTIAARADSYTFNVAYNLPVQWGPIHSLQFYNDYSLVTNKSGMLPSTFMNVSGVGVSAGDLYTYVDFVTGRNQPFIGGSMAGDGGVNHRFNINFGFYF